MARKRKLKVGPGAQLGTAGGILMGLSAGDKVGAIAARLGRAPPTISREAALHGTVVKADFCDPSLALDAGQ